MPKEIQENNQNKITAPQTELQFQDARQILDVFRRTELPTVGDPRLTSALRTVAFDLAKPGTDGVIKERGDAERLVVDVFSAPTGGDFLHMGYVKEGDEPDFRPQRQIQLIVPLDQTAEQYALRFPNAGFRNGDTTVHYKNPREYPDDEQALMETGLRWASANLVDWRKSGGFVLPEQVDTSKD